jgi:SAM-dependent methyltransferase
VSWDEAFAQRYDEWSSDMTEDVPFYVGLAREADGPLVELAVGSRRVAIPVARETGRRVVGIDTSAAMLQQARARAAEAGVELDLRERDMRDLELDEPAALIYCPFRALLHLPTWADRRRTFERVLASLRRPDVSPGTRSHSITGSPHGWTGSARKIPSLTTSAMPSATTASTSCSRAAAPARCGGRRRTSGWA